MPTFDLRSYARRGAEARIAELKQEMDAIYGAFPELRDGRSNSRRRAGGKAVVNHEEQLTGRRGPGRPAGAAVSSEPAVANGATRARKGRKPMTAAQRKAVGERMRKYWAAKKKAARA